MIRLMFLLAFLVGAAAVTGMSYIFLGVDVLALSITLIIAFVYAIGAIELVQFHKATQSLDDALRDIPNFSDEEQQANSRLAQWLDSLHGSLKYAVHSRIEGESKGLPSPVLTPYLVGLLVMLGLLGTFVGMVDTLQGSVIALQGSTDLAAIREGLAAPINGLGSAFGTSVAGVAASAMLGLMSTLSRRERIFVTRELDAKINTVFRMFSLNFNRQETYKSLQQQAKALPELASQIAVMAQNLEQMGLRLGQELNTKQDKFHDSVEQAYQSLAESVNVSLNQVVQESGQLVAKQMSPVVSEVMSEMAAVMQTHSLSTQTELLQQTERYLGNITKELHDNTAASQLAWQQGIKEHEKIQLNLSTSMHGSLSEFTQQFSNMSESFIASFIEQAQSKESERAALEEDKLAKWSDSLNQLQQISQEKFTQFSTEQSSLWQEASSSFLAESKQLAEALNLSVQVQRDAQQASTAALSDTIDALRTTALDSAENVNKQITAVNEATELSLQAREKSEQHWQQQHAEMMASVSAELKQQLNDLRDQEGQRAEKALSQLAKLETTVAAQLADLGRALEAPMSRLIETASEAPKAAAEVISKLKQEMTQNMARDNDLLEERRRIMSDLDGLSDSLAQSTVNQGKAMETLLQSSGGMLADISERFDAKVDREVSKLSEIALQFSESSIDIAGMSSAFVAAVERFSESNDKLVANLGKIELALEESGSRNNEQLAYYVAQAREIIDHSMMSQRGLIEEINQMALKRLDEVDA